MNQFKTQAQRIADINLELIKRWPNWTGEASRLIFAIRSEYEMKVEEIITYNQSPWTNDKEKKDIPFQEIDGKN